MNIHEFDPDGSSEDARSALRGSASSTCGHDLRDLPDPIDTGRDSEALFKHGSPPEASWIGWAAAPDWLPAPETLQERVGSQGATLSGLFKTAAHRWGMLVPIEDVIWDGAVVERRGDDLDVAEVE